MIRAQIFVTGVGCVGKTTIGARLTELLGRQFYERADLQIDVSGLDPVGAARRVKEALEKLA